MRTKLTLIGACENVQGNSEIIKILGNVLRLHCNIFQEFYTNAPNSLT